MIGLVLVVCGCVYVLGVVFGRCIVLLCFWWCLVCRWFGSWLGFCLLVVLLFVGGVIVCWIVDCLGIFGFLWLMLVVWMVGCFCFWGYLVGCCCVFCIWFCGCCGRLSLVIWWGILGVGWCGLGLIGCGCVCVGGFLGVWGYVVVFVVLLVFGSSWWCWFVWFWLFFGGYCDWWGWLIWRICCCWWFFWGFWLGGYCCFVLGRGCRWLGWCLGWFGSWWLLIFGGCWLCNGSYCFLVVCGVLRLFGVYYRWLRCWNVVRLVCLWLYVLFVYFVFNRGCVLECSYIEWY